MKKTMIWLVAVVLATTVLLSGCNLFKKGDAADTNATTTTTTATGAQTEEGGDQDAGTTGTGKTTATTTTQTPDNVIDWGDYFGDGDTTTGTSGTTATTTTTKPTTTTTLKPTTIDKVSLPGVDSDVDGKGRIFLSDVSLKKGVATLTIRNRTDEQKTQWITEETNYVTYACYDKDGNQLKGKGSTFGYLYIGCLEAGDEVSFTITLPEGTTSLKLTGAKIVYWTPWS